MWLDVGAWQKERSAAQCHAVAIKKISHAHLIVTVLEKTHACCNPYTQKTATTPVVEMDEAEEKDFQGVADVEEQSEEDEDYDIETEFLTE